MGKITITNTPKFCFPGRKIVKLYGVEIGVIDDDVYPYDGKLVLAEIRGNRNSKGIKKFTSITDAVNWIVNSVKHA